MFSGLLWVGTVLGVGNIKIPGRVVAISRQRGECALRCKTQLGKRWLAVDGWGLENSLETNSGTPALDMLGTALW